MMKTVRLDLSPRTMGLLMRRQHENRREKTPAEAHVFELLESLGIKYVFEKGVLRKHSFYLVDFYFPKPRKLCLEIDGKYHDTPEQRIKDRNRDNFIRNKRNMRVLRITNEQAFALNAEQLMALIDGPAGKRATRANRETALEIER